MRYTTIYVSIPIQTDDFIIEYNKKLNQDDEIIYTKKDVIKKLIDIGIDVIKGKYLKIDPKMDKFISQFQKITMEKNGEKFVYTKSKESTYYWLIEKGLEHIDE